MAELQKKKTAFVLKDSNGNLFQAMPETAAEHVSYSSANLSNELDRQKNLDIAEITENIETETENVIEEFHEETEGEMRISDDGTGQYFQICFNIYLEDTINAIGTYISPSSYSANLGFNRFSDEDGISADNYYLWDSANGSSCTAPANKRYYYDFTLDSNFTANVINLKLYGVAFYKNGLLDEKCPGNTLLTLGSSYISNSPYNTVTVNGNDWNSVPFEHPEIGDSTVVYFDCWMNDTNNSYWDGEYHEMEKFDKSITIERLTETNYRLSFYWNTIYDSSVEKTVVKRNLKTTTERVDETTASTSSQISGILQDVDISISQYISTESGKIIDEYHPYVYLGAGGIDPEDL